LVDSEHVLSFREVGKAPIGNDEGVSAFVVNFVWYGEGMVEKIVANDASLSFQSIHSWESAGALPQEEVQVHVFIRAVLLEPWVHLLKGEVNYLGAGNRESDLHLLYGLSNLVSRFFCEVLVNGNSGCIKVIRGHVITERHEKYAVIAKCVASSGQSVLSPDTRV